MQHLGRIGQVPGVDERVTPTSAAAVDPTVARRLYDGHAADLFAYVARRVGRDLAEDLIGETFRVAIEAWATFDPRRGSERMWLYGIATNLVRRHWRTEQRRLAALERSAAQRTASIDPLLAPVDGVAARVDAEREATRLLRAVAALSDDERDLLILSGWERLNSTEIGQVLGLSPSTVRSRLRRLRTELHRSTHPDAPVITLSPTGVPR